MSDYFYSCTLTEGEYEGFCEREHQEYRDVACLLSATTHVEGTVVQFRQEDQQIKVFQVDTDATGSLFLFDDSVQNILNLLSDDHTREFLRYYV